MGCGMIWVIIRDRSLCSSQKPVVFTGSSFIHPHCCIGRNNFFFHPNDNAASLKYTFNRNSGPEVWPPNMEKSWSRGSQSQRKSEKKSQRFLEKRTWKSALLIIKMDWESFCVFSRRHYDTISPVRGRPRQIWYLFKLATLNTTSWLVVKKAVASTSFSRLWRFLCGWTSASSMNLQSMVHSTIHQWQKIWCSPWNP